MRWHLLETLCQTIRLPCLSFHDLQFKNMSCVLFTKAFWTIESNKSPEFYYALMNAHDTPFQQHFTCIFYINSSFKAFMRWNCFEASSFRASLLFTGKGRGIRLYTCQLHYLERLKLNNKSADLAFIALDEMTSFWGNNSNNSHTMPMLPHLGFFQTESYDFSTHPSYINLSINKFHSLRYQISKASIRSALNNDLWAHAKATTAGYA